MSGNSQRRRAISEIVMTPAAAKLHDAAAVLYPENVSALDVTDFVSCYNESQHIIRTLDNVREAFAELDISAKRIF
jgi:hypothetical protein